MCPEDLACRDFPYKFKYVEINDCYTHIEYNNEG